MQLFISTGGFKNFPTKSINYLYNNGIRNIEISGGKFEKKLKEKILQKRNKINFNVHNYIPFFKKPFVFNLSSSNKYISSRSIKMAKKSINLISELNMGPKYYAFHAGFLFDPKIDMLGDKPVPKKIFNRKDAINQFLKNIKVLISYAKKKKVKLLIENNVVSRNQFKKYNYIPLMSDIKETEIIMKKIGNDVGILLDFGHLNVSSKSLNFSKKKYINKINKYIKAYHLSDNDRLTDQNKSFTKKCWFWKYIKKDAHFCTIEVYTYNLNLIKKLVNITSNKLSNL